MTDVQEEETQPEGEIVITVSDRIYIKTNMSPSETNIWLDRAKMMIISGDFDQMDGTE